MVFRVLALLLLCAIQAQAATRYVDHLCGDIATYNPTTRACTGGVSVSRDTVAEGVSLTVAGDTLNIRGGSYTVGVVVLSSANVTIQGFAGETAIWNFNAFGENLLIQNSNITIRNLTFDGTNGSNNLHSIVPPYTNTPVSGGTRAIAANGANSNILIEGNVFRQWAYGYLISDPVTTDVTFRNNYVHHVGKVDNAAGAYMQGARTIFEGNHYEDIGGTAMAFWTSGASPTAIDGIARSNSCLRCSRFFSSEGTYQGTSIPIQAGHINTRAPALMCAMGSNCRLYNNVFIDSLGIGIHSNHTNCHIYNNTISGNPSPESIRGYDPQFNAGIALTNVFGASNGCTVRNNIVSQPGVTDPPPFFNNTSATFSTNMCSPGSLVGLCSVDDPLFVGGVGTPEDFKLLVGSNANGGGVNLSATFTTDYGGRPRPGGGTPWSQGAWAAEAPPQPNPFTLVGEWKLDEGQGTSAVNTALSTLGSMTGTLNSAGWTQPGIIGAADLATNGTRGITITPHAFMRAITDQFGISVWWKGSNAGSGSGGCILLDDSKYAMITITGQLECGFWNGESFTTITTPVAGPNLLDGFAHHASCSYQAGGDGLRARIDNVSLAQLASFLNVNYSLNPQAFIGSYVGVTPNFTCGAGTIGQVRVFDQWIDSVSNTHLFQEQVPLGGVAQTQGQFVADNAAQSILGTVNADIAHVITDHLGYQVALTNNSGAEIVEHFPLFCQNSRVCDGFREVTNTIGAHGVAIATSPHVNMGDAVAVTLPTGGHTPVAGRVVADTINTGSETTLPHGSVTNWRYVLRFGAPAQIGDVIECRPYREISIGAGADTMLDHYFDDLLASIPTITLVGPPSAGLRLGGTSRGGTLR